MITAHVLAACLLLSARTYEVPPAVMLGIMHVEGGRVGQQVGPNKNNTYDLGPMQVNTRWLPDLAKAWNVDVKTAHTLVRDDGCVNVRVAAWILSQKIRDAGSLFGGIAYYHSATPHHGAPYAAKVIRTMEKKGLIKRDYAKDAAKTYIAQK